MEHGETWRNPERGGIGLVWSGKVWSGVRGSSAREKGGSGGPRVDRATLIWSGLDGGGLDGLDGLE